MMDMAIRVSNDDGAKLVDCMANYGQHGMRSRCRCVECGKWLRSGWSYLDKPVDGNYIECSRCRYGTLDESEYVHKTGQF